jgi:hypothetical protein
MLWAAGALLSVWAGGPAEAKIACDKGYQMVQGNPLATPYCQDEYVAEVAHEYGMEASADKVRNNPNFKRELCRFIGNDIRIKDTCSEVESNGRGRF